MYVFVDKTLQMLIKFYYFIRSLKIVTKNQFIFYYLKNPVEYFHI